MKKYIILFLIAFALYSCESNDLKLMAVGLERHIIENDEKDGIQTRVEKITPISYIKLADSEKEIPEEKYSAKIYLKAVWQYNGGNNVYNISDTLDCYFDKDFKCLRTIELHKEK